MAKNSNRPSLLHRALQIKRIPEPVIPKMPEPEEIVFEKGEFAEAQNARKLFRALGIKDTDFSAVASLKFQEIEEAYYALEKTTQPREWLQQSFTELEWHKPKASKFLPRLIDHISRNGKSALKPARYALEELDTFQRLETYRHVWTKLYLSDASKMAQINAAESAKKLEQKTDKVLHGLRKAIHAYNVRNKDVPKDTPIHLREPFVLSELGITPYQTDLGFLMGLDLSGFRFPEGSDFSRMNLRGTKLLVPAGAMMRSVLFGKDADKGILNNTRFIRGSDIHSLRPLLGTPEFTTDHIDGLSNASGYVAIFRNNGQTLKPITTEVSSAADMRDKTKLSMPPEITTEPTGTITILLDRGPETLQAQPSFADTSSASKGQPAQEKTASAGKDLLKKRRLHATYEPLGYTMSDAHVEAIKKLSLDDVKKLREKVKQGTDWLLEPMPITDIFEEATLPTTVEDILHAHILAYGEQEIDPAVEALKKLSKRDHFNALKDAFLNYYSPPSAPRVIPPSKTAPPKDNTQATTPRGGFKQRVSSTAKAAGNPATSIDDIPDTKQDPTEERDWRDAELPPISTGTLIQLLKERLPEDAGLAHQLEQLMPRQKKSFVTKVTDELHSDPHFARKVIRAIVADPTLLAGHIKGSPALERSVRSIVDEGLKKSGPKKPKPSSEDKTPRPQRSI